MRLTKRQLGVAAAELREAQARLRVYVEAVHAGEMEPTLVSVRDAESQAHAFGAVADYLDRAHELDAIPREGTLQRIADALETVARGVGMVTCEKGLVVDTVQVEIDSTVGVVRVG